MRLIRASSPRRQRAGAFTAAALIFLALALVLPASLYAGKQKDPAPPPAAPGGQRVKAVVDIAKIVWPSPPAIPRIAFQDLFTGEKVDPSLYTTKGKKQNWMDRLAGTQSNDEIRQDKLPFQLTRTYGVGVDSKGQIYAADQAVGAVFIFDAEKKDHVEMIGNGRQAHFGLIAGLALDDDDRLFVVDVQLRHVLVLNPQHMPVGVFGGEVLVRPGGIAIDRENRFLYVTDTGNDVVDVFDPDTFKFLRQIGKPSKKHEATDPGTFSLPEGVAVDKEGNVFVTDTLNNRVEIFDADGEFISEFGKNGDGPADLQRPKGIAVDGDGHIWVVDAAQNMVKVFNRQGRLLITFGGAGYYPGQFMGPWGIAIDATNRVIVSETFPGRVQVFHYVTDAQAASLKAQRDADAEKAAAARTSGRKDTSATKSAAVAPATLPASQDPAAKKNSPAQ